MIQSLRDDGILYIEIRTVDINSFDKCGISKKDMQFLHLFIIYLLIKEETEYDKWQEEGVYNEEKIAEQGYNPHTVLLKNGQETNLKEWGQEIVNEMKEMNKELNLQKEELINMAEVKINDFSKTHGKELVNINTINLFSLKNFFIFKTPYCLIIIYKVTNYFYHMAGITFKFFRFE